MTTFAEPGAYQAIIIPAGSIMLLDGRDAVPRALAAFRESLSPGGRLILDVGSPGLITGPEAMRYWERDQYLWTLQVMHTGYDRVANQVTSFLRYEKWRDGGLIATELQRFRLQYWSLAEFGRLLADAGFTDIRVTADHREDHGARIAQRDLDLPRRPGALRAASSALCLSGFGCGGRLGAVMTLAARLLVARAQATSRKAARKRRAELERELAGYATGADRCDFEAMLDRYPDGVTHELRSILSRQYMASQEMRFPAIGRN
jgi:hypothetical protein